MRKRALLITGFIGINICFSCMPKYVYSQENAYNFQSTKQLESRVRQLIKKRNFLKLDALAATLFKEKSRFDSGDWQLKYFYDFLQRGFEEINVNDRKEFLKFLKDWQKASPKTIVPRIALAKAYIYYAWKSRGGKWAYKVTEQGWKGFYEDLNSAWDVLNKAEALGITDPEFYHSKIKVMNALGMPEEEIEKVFQEAVKFEPLYYRNYDVRALFLLPRWGGTPGQLGQFADQAVKYTKAAEGEGLYARIVWGISWITKSPSRSDAFFEENNFSWQRVKQGFYDIEKLYPDSPLNWNRFCYLACMADDRKTAKELFDRISPAWDDAKSGVWRKENRFYQFREWACGKGEYPNDKKAQKAAKEGDLPALSEFLKAGGDVNARDVDGLTLLHWAMRSDHPNSDKVIEFLLENGADINARSHERWSVLNDIIAENRLDWLEEFLKRGVNYNVRADYGYSPLLLSIWEGNTKAALRLLELKDINVNAQLKDGRTPLYLAIEKGHQTIAFRLLERSDVDLNLKTKDAWSPLYLAAVTGETSLVSAMLKKQNLDVNCKTKQGWPPLIAAISKKYTDIALMLLDKEDIDVNVTATDDWTALHYAAYKGNVDIVKSLLAKKNVNINAFTSRNYSPLLLAVQEQYADIVKLLIDKGANINGEEGSPWTPLDLAQSRYLDEMIELLKSYGAQ